MSARLAPTVQPVQQQKVAVIGMGDMKGVPSEVLRQAGQCLYNMNAERKTLKRILSLIVGHTRAIGAVPYHAL